MTYDIFISYRRTAFESANVIATKLRAEGYRVFLDVESLRSGNFNDQLFDVIDNCKDFLLILPPNALDRCDEPEDWVRKEVLRAIEGKKNIIPVMLAGFQWPPKMPEGMKDLPLYQAITASSIEYFDLSIRRLTEQYLKSKPKRLIVLKRIGIILCSLVIVLGTIWGIARLMSIPLCNRFANEMTDHLVRLDLLGGYVDKNYAEWKAFLSKEPKAKTQQQLSNLLEEMFNSIDDAKTSIKKTAPADSLQKQYSFFETVLFASRGISVLEVEVEPIFAASYFPEFIENLDYMNNALKRGDLGSVSRKTIDANNDISKHLLAMAYYSYMELMAKMPKNAQKRYLEVAKQFKSLPNDVPLTLTTDEYIQRQNNENTQCERIMLDLEAYVKNASARLDELDDKVAIVDGFINSIQQLNEIQESNEVELALRREKIEAKKQINEQKKAQLEELDREYQKAYEELKANCALEESDGKWYKWGKIVKFATFMEQIVQSRKKLSIQGVYSTSSVTPEVAYATLASMLNSFMEYHPESVVLAETAKAYYKEVSKGRRTISGVIISAIKDDMEHPVHQVGDIIVSMKETPISNFEELKTAFKKDGAPQEEFLRLSYGVLREYKVDDCGSTDIIGYNDLKQ